MKLLSETIPFFFESLQSDSLHRKNIRITIARLDKIHPIISGNKIFKLHYFLKKAIDEKKAILTYGGPYSNHLVATAYACREAGLECTGIVRGESSTHTIQQCKEYGMQIKYLSREEYKIRSSAQAVDHTLVEIPEGGYHPLGARGAGLIMEGLRDVAATHICMAVGTATTLAGILHNSDSEFIIAVPVIKNMADLPDRINYLNGGNTGRYPHVLDMYHFGGYAKHTPQLTGFMNMFYQQHRIPTDFVYTAKMMYGIFDQVEKDLFPAGSHILCLHTGGLQGNESLAPGTLIF